MNRRRRKMILKMKMKMKMNDMIIQALGVEYSRTYYSASTCSEHRVVYFCMCNL